MVPIGTKEKSNISIFRRKFGPNMDLGRFIMDPICTQKSIFKEGSRVGNFSGAELQRNSCYYCILVYTTKFSTRLK